MSGGARGYLSLPLSACLVSIPQMQRRKPKTIRGEECWLCPTCGRWVPRRDYYPRLRSWNGIGGQCKRCHIEGSIRTRDKENARRLTRESGTRARKRNPERFREKWRLASRKRPRTRKTEARSKLNAAVKRGDVLRPDRCTGCGEAKKLHAHHSDYSRPLFVEWLCSPCHAVRHQTGGSNG